MKCRHCAKHRTLRHLFFLVLLHLREIGKYSIERPVFRLQMEDVKNVLKAP